MSQEHDELQFCQLVQSEIEPQVSYELAATVSDRLPAEWGHPFPPTAGAVVDAEGTLLCVTPTLDKAEVICKLLDWALEHYPNPHPDDPEFIRKGFV